MRFRRRWARRCDDVRRGQIYLETHRRIEQTDGYISFDSLSDKLIKLGFVKFNETDYMCWNSLVP